MRGWSSGLVLLLLLAGCASPTPNSETPSLGEDVDVQVTATTGAIRGVVVDEAIRPIAGVQVSLVAANRVLNTTDSGTFAFSGLEPGTYLVEAVRFGFSSARQTVDVVAGDREPRAMRIQLLRDPSQVAYSSVQTFTGFIVCTTSAVATCGAPNVVSNVLLCPVFNVCLGNVTDDRFGFDLFYEPNATYIQSELVWSSTQPLSTQLSMQMETIVGCDAEYYERSVAGDSPLVNYATADEIAAAQIGGECSIFHSIFSGDTAGTPLGVTVQQQYEVFSHSFYGYLPPEGWSFGKDGAPPAPPK